MSDFKRSEYIGLCYSVTCERLDYGKSTNEKARDVKPFTFDCPICGNALYWVRKGASSMNYVSSSRKKDVQTEDYE